MKPQKAWMVYNPKNQPIAVSQFKFLSRGRASGIKNCEWQLLQENGYRCAQVLIVPVKKASKKARKK